MTPLRHFSLVFGTLVREIGQKCSILYHFLEHFGYTPTGWNSAQCPHSVAQRAPHRDGRWPSASTLLGHAHPAGHIP